jgi:hypothetical protein
MKKIMSLALMLLVFAFIYGTQAKAQVPKRIQFAKGQNSAVIKGTTVITALHMLLEQSLDKN